MYEGSLRPWLVANRHHLDSFLDKFRREGAVVRRAIYRLRIHTTIQPYNHTTIQPYNHTYIHTYIHTYNHTYNHTTIQPYTQSPRSTPRPSHPPTARHPHPHPPTDAESGSTVLLGRRRHGRSQSHGSDPGRGARSGASQYDPRTGRTPALYFPDRPSHPRYETSGGGCGRRSGCGLGLGLGLGLGFG